jgi:hypothetical protein
MFQVRYAEVILHINATMRENLHIVVVRLAFTPLRYFLMKGNEEFSAGLGRAFGEILAPAIKSHEEEMATRMMNHLLDLHEPVANVVEDTKEIRILGQIVNGTSEIQSAFESLLDVEVYVRRFPYRNTRISKSRHLRYAIGNYLNQVYVLKQRLKRFLQDVEELYAQGRRRKEVKRITQALFAYLSTVFEGMVAIRGSHVHRESYSDKELSQLEGLDFTIKVSEGMSWQDLLAHLLDLRYKEIRRQRVEEIRNANKVIEAVIDEYFSRLYPVVFDDDGNLIIPEIDR